MKVSRRIDRLGAGVFHRNDVRKHAYRLESSSKQLPPLFDLSLGSTDILPPKSVIEAIRQALPEQESSSYCLYSDTRLLRDSVSMWAQRRFGVSVDPDSEVLFLVGSQEGTAHLPLAVMDPGDTGLILDPSYPSHMGGLVLADAHIERLLLKADREWKPDFCSLSDSQLDQLKIIIFGFPHNPTSCVGDQSWLDQAMQCGLRHQVVIAHDNPYVDLSLDGAAPALLRCDGWRKCGIEFFSFSKAWCLGGFRLGFAIGAKNVIAALRQVKSVIDFNQSLALQMGAIEALSSSAAWPNEILGVYRTRRDRTIKAFAQLGWQVPVPSMAMYLWMPLPHWAKNRGWDDELFAAKLLDETGIALTPGAGFGTGGAGWLRLALVRPVDELEAAVSRIGPWWNEHS